jgi:hypothetical protein
MAYSTSNPPVMFEQVGPAGPRLWFYNSADAATTVRVSGYFTNGVALGMKDKDLIWAQGSGTGATTMHIVNVSGGVVDLSDGIVIASATNSD